MASTIPADALCYICLKPGCDTATPTYSMGETVERAVATGRWEPHALKPVGVVYSHAACEAKDAAAFDAYREAEKAKARAAGKIVLDHHHEEQP